jgi:hypothetical protein
MKLLRVLGVLVVVAFAALLIVGFDNALALLRSRVAIFLAIVPFIALFLWSIWKAIPHRKKPGDEVIDITPPKEN